MTTLAVSPRATPQVRQIRREVLAALSRGSADPTTPPLRSLLFDIVSEARKAGSLRVPRDETARRLIADVDQRLDNPLTTRPYDSQRFDPDEAACHKLLIRIYRYNVDERQRTPVYLTPAQVAKLPPPATWERLCLLCQEDAP